jgi:hypothetical protein
MAKWEIAICSKDEADLESGHKRKKRGDIIAIVPYPHVWGRKEVLNHTIIIVDNLTEEEVNEMKKPLYENDIEPDLDESKKPLAKRKFKVDLDKIKTNIKTDLDFDRIEDFSDNYQPFKDEELVIDADSKAVDFDFIKNKHTNKFKKAKKL